MTTRSTLSTAIFAAKATVLAAVPITAIFLNAACNTHEAALTFIVWVSALALLFWAREGFRGGDEGAWTAKGYTPKVYDPSVLPNFDSANGIFFPRKDDIKTPREKNAADFYESATRVAAHYSHAGPDRQDMIQDLVLFGLRKALPQYNPELSGGLGRIAGYMSTCFCSKAKDIYAKVVTKKNKPVTAGLRVSQLGAEGNSKGSPDGHLEEVFETRLFGARKAPVMGADEDKKELIAVLNAIEDKLDRAIYTAACAQQELIAPDDVKGVRVMFRRGRVLIGYANDEGGREKLDIAPGVLRRKLTAHSNSDSARAIGKIMLARINSPTPGGFVTENLI